MSVTLAEVARRAGVSQATVSYVLNDAPGQTISAVTREKVLGSARALGYRPNAAARSLRTGRGEAVLFPVAGPPNHVLSQLIDACSDALTARGLTLVTDPTRYDDVEAQLDAWLRVRPAAVLDLLIPHDDPVLASLRRADVTVLSSARPSEAPWASSADVFAIEARRTQLSYLLERGHRHIALVIPPRFPTDPRVERSGLRQLRRLAAEGGATLETSRVRLATDDMRGLVAGWIRTRLPEAVCAGSDDYAIAVMTALVRAGIRVPDDVAVIGVDDLPSASYVTPSLTTVAADFDELAESVASAVIDLLVDATARIQLPRPAHHLVRRESA